MNNRLFALFNLIFSFHETEVKRTIGCTRLIAMEEYFQNINL